MRLHCNDGIVRRFSPAHVDGEFTKNGRSEGSVEAMCLECDAGFGVHDTAVLKPMFRSHRCVKTILPVMPATKYREDGKEPRK